MKGHFIYILSILIYNTVFSQKIPDTSIYAKYLDSSIIDGVFVREFSSVKSDNSLNNVQAIDIGKVIYRFIPFFLDKGKKINSPLEIIKSVKQKEGFFATYRDWDITYGIKDDITNELGSFYVVDSIFGKTPSFEIYGNEFASFVFGRVVFYRYLFFNKNLVYLQYYVHPDEIGTKKSFEVYYPKRLLLARGVKRFPFCVK